MKDAAVDVGMGERIPLTSSQRELWLSRQASLSEYNETSIRGCFHVENALCPDRLREAICLVQEYAPLLTAVLREDGSGPYLQARKGAHVDLVSLDFRQAGDPEGAAREFTAVFLEQSVDEQPVRYAVLRTGEEQCVFLCKCSHLVLDGLGIFFHVSFITEIYSALVQGKDPGLDGTCPCDDLYLQDREHCASARYAKDIAFWEEHLERMPEKRIFRARPGCVDVLGNTRYRKYPLSEEASAKLANLFAGYGVGPAVYFTALHALVAAFMCGEKGIAIQTPIAFGERKAHGRRLGAQIATPPVFADVSAHDSFASLAADIGGQNARFFRHIRTPYQQAMRNLTHKNLTYVADTFINYLPGAPKGNADFSIRAVEQWHSEQEPILFGALVLYDPASGECSLTVRSSRNHFSEQDVERYVRRIELLTHQLASGVDLPDLEYLLDEEKEELLLWQQGLRREYAVCSMPSLFEERAWLFAQHPAVRDEHGAVLTYAEVRDNARKCAAWLAVQGVKPGDIVAVLARRVMSLPEIALGIMWCGAVYLPVDPSSPAERIEYIVSDAKAVLTMDPGDTGYRQTPLHGMVEEGPVPAAGDGAYLIYTSGSTGRPKGVLVPHGGFVNMIQGQIEFFGIGGDDRVLQFASPSFDASLSEMFMALYAGACLYPVSDRLRNEPWTLNRYMAENGVTVTTFPPSYLHVFDKEEFPGLRVLITAGEPPVAEDALHYAGMLEYVNAYGPTETCVCASMKRVAPDEALPISVGRPIPNGTAYILNAQRQPLPAGMAGELWIGGASLALSYHGNAELTQARFCELPPLCGVAVQKGQRGQRDQKDQKDRRAYATGDMAVWSEAGEIILVGRGDDQVKIRGNRVELGEVAFLLESCGSVRQAFAVAAEDASGQTMLAGFLVLRDGAGLEEVIGWSKDNLPAYMIPSRWHVLDAMPVTVTGKIDRNALKRLVNAPSGGDVARQPVDPVLLEICGRVLGAAYDPLKNFFDQGGNSLKAMTLLRELRKAYAVDVVFREFVKCDSLFEVEDLLHRSRPKQEDVSGDTVPLSRNQFQVWAYQQANDRSIDYNMPFLLEVRGGKAETFVELFRQAVNGQELLLCTVAGAIDSPCFRKSHAGGVAVRVSEFSGPEAVEAYFDGIIHTPFDLRTEPPVRLEAAKLPDGSYRMLVLLHHIAGDGETLDILLNNALRYMRGEAVENGHLAVQAAYCRRQEEYFRSADFAADRTYWEEVLNPPPPAVNPGSKRKGAMVKTALTQEFVAGLERMAQQTGATVISCFATLLARFLCEQFGREEVLIGVPVAMRETQEEFRTAGFFVNTVPLRVRRSAAEETVAVIRDTALQLRKALAHSRYSHTEIVPEFLATHSETGHVEGQGVMLRRLEPQLRASKLSGSFTLETGTDAGLFLEYDAGLIPDGVRFLEELKRTVAEACGGLERKSSAQVLTDAWSEILRTEPGGGSDFFRDGGDSIKAIQITGILHRNAIRTLSAPDFMRTPSFAELCALVAREDESLSGGEAEYSKVQAGDAVPLLPVQHALMREHPGHWGRFYMMLPMVVSDRVAQGAAAWLESLPERYEALRMAFTPEGAVVLRQPQRIVLLQRTFGAQVTETELCRDMARESIAGIDPEAGRTLGAGLAEQEGRRFLVLVGHHLVLDTFSLDVLRRDLLDFCLNRGRTEEAYGVASRAAAVAGLVEQGAFPAAGDREFWQSVCSTPVCALAAVRPGRDVAAERGLAVRQVAGFSPEYTQSAQADMVCALAVALYAQGQREAVFLTLESHGRDALLAGMDMSRSVGWFTAVCPMPLQPAPTCEQADGTVRPWLKEHFSPLGCNAYGYLKQEDPERFGYASQIGFNYLGTLTAGGGGDAEVLAAAAVPGTVPELLHPDFEPDSPLDLCAFFDESGVLHLGAYFSGQKLPQEWVDGLLDGWTEALKTLPAYREPLPDEVRARIPEVCGCAAEDIESIIPPDVCHEPLLFQSLTADKGVYTQQITFHFRGEADVFPLMRAWGAVVARHESLRSLFPAPYDGEFYRVVLHRARTGTEYHDLSHLPEADARAEMELLLAAQRGRGFDLGRGPLIRAQFFTLTGGSLAMSWCFHHLLMDGWCIGILLRELFSLYNQFCGRPAKPLPQPVPLAGYTRWRAGFDENAARTYWRTLLQGFRPMTGLAGRGSAPEQAAGAGHAEPESLTLELDNGVSKALQGAASDRSVTLSVLVQALWAIVLSGENGGCRDVVYGVVTSGRPAELEGMDRAVGLFIQTLPLRARWTGQSGFSELLDSVKEQGLQQMRHGYLPLAEMGKDLLDHLMVFENYPVEAVSGGDGLEIGSVSGFEKIPYPLGISVIPGERLFFRFLYNPSALNGGYVCGLRDKLHALLRAVASLREMDRSVGRDKGDSSGRDMTCQQLEDVAEGVVAGSVIVDGGAERGASEAGAAVTGQPDGQPDGLSQGQPEGVRVAGAAGAEVAPAEGVDELEAVLLEIYASVLGCAVPSADADFFQLGGHSLLAMRVMAQISKRLELDVAIEDILVHSSVRRLAARMRKASVRAVRIERVPRREVYPLSASQTRIWFLQRLHGDSRVHLVPFAARVQAPVDVEALQQALTMLEERHDALRLRVDADRPEQRLVPAGSLRLEVRDEPFTDSVPDSIMEMPFGHDSVLARVVLFREGESGGVLFFCFHHIIIDGWSAEIFIRELNQAYDAVLRNVAPAWQPQELDYPSYVEWELGQDVAGIESIKEALLPLPERLRLPVDYPRPPMQSFAGGALIFELGEERSRELRSRAQHMGVTLFSLLVATVKTFLYRHTGQTDLTVGCPAANRELEQVQNMIGLFVNTLVIRTRLDADKDFDSLVAEVHGNFQKALATQSYPFGKVVEALEPGRNPVRNPLFDVFVALEDQTFTNYGHAPLYMQPMPLRHDRSKFDLSFYFRETEPDRFEVHMEYCADLFSRETLNRMRERFITLLDGVLRGDGTPLAALEVFAETERALVESFNHTDEAFDIERDADSCFAEQVRANGKAVAIVDADGVACTYEAFSARVSALAAQLESEGLSRGDYACVCFDRSPEMMLAIFAVMRIGATYVPLAADLPESRLQSIFDDLGICSVISDSRHAERFVRCGQHVIVPDMGSLSGQEHVFRQQGSQEYMFMGAGPVSPGAVAYVIFTSGSTGRPKGVQIEHRSLCNRLLWMQSRFPIGEGDVVLQKTTVSFDVSVWELFWWSWCGASLALLEPEGEKDPAALVRAIFERRVTVVHFVPSMLRVFLDYLEARPDEAARLGTLRYVFTSGEALSAELAVRFNRMLRAELHNLYGPTEAAIDVTWYPCLRVPEHGVPIGRPVSNTRVYVLDDRRRLVPVGVTGELYISGVQVARGYVNRPDITAASFSEDPFRPGSRMYRTGDLGRWRADGNIEYLGRNDDQVKIRGHRIELGEVEAALGRCPGVSQAVVRVCRMGGQDALEAFLVPHGGGLPSLKEIRNGLSEHLPEYMWPARFLEADSIPLSASGKADRKRAEGRPLVPEPRAAADGLTPLEEEIRQLWREVLPEADVRDADMGFFEAGGNSLLLVRLHALLDERWKGVFTLGGLFAESTIRAQAQSVGQVRCAAADAAPQAAANAPVAIIGMAVRLGDYEETERFWEDLVRGADKNVPLPAVRQREVRQILETVGFAYDPSRLREAAYLSDISSFDHRRFGLSPNDASLLDPKQRVFLEVALQALDDAGYGGTALESRNVGVFVGASPFRLFQDAVTRAFPEQAEQIYLLNVPSNSVARLSYLKNWSGSASMVDTACSSVLKALHDACQSLRAGENVVALVGGVHTIDLPVKGDRAFTIEASSGRTMTFDAKADGVGAGEGGAVFVLKLLDRALADNDAIHAVIAGSAVNQDGRASSMAAPNPAAQGEVIALAARNAGVSLADVSFFEAHGTATVLGDPGEVEGLGKAFAREGADLRRKALIGSVKGNVGHLDAAAGAVGLAKAVLSLKKGQVPPQPHFETPNPHIDFDAAPVRVARVLESLPPEERPWVCGVSSFGLSGINTHVMLREHVPAPVMPDVVSGKGSWYCVPLSANDEAALREYCRRMRETLSRHPDLPLHAIAGTLVAGRDHLDVRAVLVADSAQSVREQLEQLELFEQPGQPGQPDRDVRIVTCTRVPGPGIAGAVFATREEAESAADEFLRGSRMFWPQGVALHRAHLPATVFSRTPLWPKFAARFVSAPVRTPEGAACSVAIGRDDFWPVAEHLLLGVPTLAGMGVLDLIGMAVGRMPLRVENLRWHKPVTYAEGSEATLLLKGNGDAVAMELHHAVQGAWSVAVRAGVRSAGMEHADGARDLDIESLRGSMPLPEPGDGQGDHSDRTMADQKGQGLVSVSARWDCRRELRVSADGDSLLALLVLPDEYRHDLHTFKWHPAMVDLAASLALHGTAGFVPARCGAAHLFRPLPARVYAWVRITDRQPGTITADCTVADMAGRVLLQLTDMVFVSLNAGRAEPELYGVQWAEAALPEMLPVAGESGQGGPSAMADGLLLSGGSEDGPHRSLHEALAPVARLCRALPARAEKTRTGDDSDDMEKDAARELAAEILREGVTHVVYLPAAGDGAWAFCALLQEICRAGLRRPLHITAVGSGALVQPETGPEHALVLGTLLALRQEEPLLSCAYAELDEVNEASVQAFMETLGLIEGAYVVDGEGRVRVQVLEPVAGTASSVLPTTVVATAVATAVAPEGCVVITGAPGGMAMTLAAQLTAEAGVRVALLHRRREGIGDVPFAAYCCDVTDAAQVEETLGRIRREVGPVQGVIHAAGVAGEGYLLSKGRGQYEAVLAPKVAGTWNLHKATFADDLKFFVLASSRTSLTGAPGQTDYTAANAFLNAFARYRRRQGLPALSLCWNTWSGVGMAARMGAAHGGTPLMPEQALDVLNRALCHGGDVVVVGMSDEDVSRFRTAEMKGQAVLPQASGMPYSAGTQGPQAENAVAATPERGGEGAAPMARAERTERTERTERAAGSVDALEAEILEIFRDCLGYDAPLGRGDDFFDLGGDSIAGTRVVGRISQALGVSASVVDLLESDSLGDFMDRVLAGMQQEAAAPQGIAPAPVRDTYPVGREQLSVLYADMLGSGNTAYNLPAFLRLPADVDKARLEQSIATLIERHEVLRTSFCDFDEEHPNMVIHPFEGFTLEEVHVADIALKESFIRPFDLKRERGFRAMLLVVNGTENVLYYDIHHALADGRTISLFNVELYALYHGQPLEPVRLQMKDFAWHQFTHASREDKEYWHGVFRDGVPTLDLPSDFPRPPVHTFRGGAYEFELPAGVVAGIKGLARREGVTNYHVVMTAWAVLVHAYTGNEDVVLAVTVDNRKEYLNTAGMLASLQPLRLGVRSGTPMGRLLKENQALSNEALRHSSYILNDLLMDMKPPLCPERSLLSEVILSYMNFEYGTGDYRLFESLRFSKPVSDTDLTIFVSDVGDRISFALEYYADLFSRDNVIGMAEDVVRILEKMTTGDPALPVDFVYVPRERRAVASVRRVLPVELRERLGGLAEGSGVCVEAVLLATFAVLLGRVTGRQDLEVDVDGGLVAFRLDDDTEFDDLLLRTQAELTAVRDAGDVPYQVNKVNQASQVNQAAARPDVWSATQVDGETGEGGVLRVAFGYGNAGSGVQNAALERGHDLVCLVQDSAGGREGTVVRFDHDTRLLAVETAEDWLGYYENFLTGIAG